MTQASVRHSPPPILLLSVSGCLAASALRASLVSASRLASTAPRCPGLPRRRASPVSAAPVFGRAREPG
jgi:hypothetical protein